MASPKPHAWRILGVASYKLSEPDTVTQARDLSYCSEYEGRAPAEQQHVCLRLPNEFILQGSRSSEVRLTTFFEQLCINISCLQDAQSKDGIRSCESLGQGRYVTEASIRHAEIYMQDIYIYV